MAAAAADLAKEAFIDDHFELAVDLYTQAISLCPNSADLFADRAQANIKLNCFTEAVADANRAIELEASMAKAYLRKGTACMKLEEYQTAKVALEKGASLAPTDSRFIKLIKECDEHIAVENNELPKLVADQSANSAANSHVPKLSDEVMDTAKEAQATALVTKPKYRHEHYQKPEEVVVTIFAKGVPAETVSVDYGDQILSVRIDIAGEDAYIFQQRLFGKIVPAKCKYQVLSTKIEIRLAKAESVHWNFLEYVPGNIVHQKINVSSVVTQPSYPSSKSKGTDWDKLEAEVKKEEKDEKLEGDAALNKFFREIYQDADEDTRRAMSKSFVESNGTVLSTNWKEVGVKKVEGSPPDGMEVKKWEY